jgi:hypothetical protein
MSGISIQIRSNNGNNQPNERMKRQQQQHPIEGKEADRMVTRSNCTSHNLTAIKRRDETMEQHGRHGVMVKDKWVGKNKQARDED